MPRGTGNLPGPRAKAPSRVTLRRLRAASCVDLPHGLRAAGTALDRRLSDGGDAGRGA